MKKPKFDVVGNKANGINAQGITSEYFKQTGKKITTFEQFKEKLNINPNNWNNVIRKKIQSIETEI